MTYTGYCLTDYDKEKCKDCPTLLDCMDFGINELSNQQDVEADCCPECKCRPIIRHAAFCSEKNKQNKIDDNEECWCGFDGMLCPIHD